MLNLHYFLSFLGWPKCNDFEARGHVMFYRKQCNVVSERSGKACLTSWLQYFLQHVSHSTESFPAGVAKTRPYLFFVAHDSNVPRRLSLVFPGKCPAFAQTAPEREVVG